MSTTVTVAVAAPNHLPVRVTVQDKRKTLDGHAWVDDPSYSRVLKVGDAMTVCIYDGRRIVCEELPS